MQDMSTSELDECEPVLGFLAPACANAAPFDQPTEGSFDGPPSSRVTGLSRNGVGIGWFAPFASSLDVWDAMCIFHNLADIIKVVAFVCTKMLLYRRTTHFRRAGDGCRVGRSSPPEEADIPNYIMLPRFCQEGTVWLRGLFSFPPARGGEKRHSSDLLKPQLEEAVGVIEQPVGS